MREIDHFFNNWLASLRLLAMVTFGMRVPIKPKVSLEDWQSCRFFFYYRRGYALSVMTNRPV